MPAPNPADYAATITAALVAQAPLQQAKALATFAENFWRGVVADDLVDRDLNQDTQLTWEAWEAFAAFDPDRPVVDVAPARYGVECSVVKILTTDTPFITDSVLMEISRQQLNLRYLHNVTLKFRASEAADGAYETLIFAEVDLLDANQSAALISGLETALADVQAVVADHQAMRQQALAMADTLGKQTPAEYREASEFLHWLCADHFTFLGFRSFDFGDSKVRQVPGSELGYLTRRPQASERAFADLQRGTLNFLLEPTLLSFSKAGSPSRVHRPAYPDYVGIKRFDDKGNVVGEDGFLGLYTSTVYTAQASSIPVVRRKVANVLSRSGFRPGSFDAKALAQVLATYPRDELLQTSEDELFATTMDIAHLHERRKTKVFLRAGRYGLFYTCLVYLPRDHLHTRVRTGIADLLTERLQAVDVEFDSYFSESVLVRLQYILRVNPDAPVAVNEAALEQEIVLLAQDWQEELLKSLPASAEQQNLAQRFPSDYREQFDIATAGADIQQLLALAANPAGLSLAFYRKPGADASQVNLKLFVQADVLPLTRVVPVLENLGFEVISEHPYHIADGASHYTIQDLALNYASGLALEAVGENFAAAFSAIWHGDAESDAFNRLVLAQDVPWRDVTLLRAYAAYMWQAGFGFERFYIANTLNKHAAAAKLLVEHFCGLLQPGNKQGDRSDALREYLDSVPLLNEDRVLRLLMQLIEATVRTNYFQPAAEIETAPLVFKLAAEQLTALPLPRPKFEIFVYAPDVEGVHLRSSAVARGGIRWSDRFEDYRTEVLGLVKAQIVKNSVIVPSGAKGGFVVKRSRDGMDAAAWQEEGIRCYKRFIAGLLSVTDNLNGTKLVPPANVVRRDADDAYLVVAADKGTATFSDIANGIAMEQGFWLGDAFASGGSVGYDHKKMGITAKGAWVSVQRHFRRLGVDPQTQPITAVGVGDMGGDVFGNGMLRSRSMQLLAAFNHLHIFVDPNPDTEAAFVERQRLFDLPRSSWEDYNTQLISAGGGVFARSQKSIPISAAMRSAFAIDSDALPPDELIRALLLAPVDLLWNGGIGTYVKASLENNADVGDRANDSLRVNGAQLRAKVVGEGGNLGLTHKGRIEFAAAGGLVNADFIDNAGGVDCSDHEVNIKIYLAQLTQDKTLSASQRDEFLLSLDPAVEALVLANNFLQARCLSLASDHSQGRTDEYNRLAVRLEQVLQFDRAEADFPNEELLEERQRQGTGLLAPELSTLLGYAKILLKQELASAELHLDPGLAQIAASEFPADLVETYPQQLANHRLFPDIVNTLLANRVVGYGGITLVNRIVAFTGCDAAQAVRAYWVAADVFDFEARMDWLDSLDASVADKRASMLSLMRWLRRAVRWLVYELDTGVGVQALQTQLKPMVTQLLQDPQRLYLSAWEQERLAQREAKLQLGPQDAPQDLAQPALGFEMFGALPVAAAALASKSPVAQVAAIYQQLGEALDFAGLNEFLVDIRTGNHWRAMERDALLDDLCHQHVALTQSIAMAQSSVDEWLVGNAELVERWQANVAEVRLDAVDDLAGIAMTVRKLVDLAKRAA